MRLFGHGLFDHVHNNAKFCKQATGAQTFEKPMSQKRYMKQVPF
jgi:hypothetical protein